MKDTILVWIGAAAAVVIYLAMCSIIDNCEARVEQCRIVRCSSI